MPLEVVPECEVVGVPPPAMMLSIFVRWSSLMLAEVLAATSGRWMPEMPPEVLTALVSWMSFIMPSWGLLRSSFSMYAGDVVSAGDVSKSSVTVPIWGPWCGDGGAGEGVGDADIVAALLA